MYQVVKEALKKIWKNSRSVLLSDIVNTHEVVAKWNRVVMYKRLSLIGEITHMFEISKIIPLGFYFLW